MDADPNPVEKPGPRTWYYGQSPFEGDEDFLAWQRRKRSVNRWDVIAALSIPASIGAGAGTFRLSGSSAAAIGAFALVLLVGAWASVRKWYWAHTGR